MFNFTLQAIFVGVGCRLDDRNVAGPARSDTPTSPTIIFRTLTQLSHLSDTSEEGGGVGDDLTLVKFTVQNLSVNPAQL